METVVLSREQVRGLIDMPAVLSAVESGFGRHGRGETRMPPKVYLPLPEHDGDFRAMPVYFPATDSEAASAGVKWVNAHPKNPAKHNLPSVLGVFILSDPETAQPLAVMDATELTAVRTGAASAVATKHLAPEGASTLGIIGCGVQAHTVIRAHECVMTELREIRLFDLDAQAAASVAAAFPNLNCRAATIEDAVGSDVLCTLTPSRTPVVPEGLASGPLHINAMGADAPGKQELPTETVVRARVFLDDMVQASESGEVNVPLSSGALAPDAIAGTLGECVAGRIPGRTAGEEITLFDSTGLAVQDLAVAGIVYRHAIDAGVGTRLALT